MPGCTINDSTPTNFVFPCFCIISSLRRGRWLSWYRLVQLTFSYWSWKCQSLETCNREWNKHAHFFLYKCLIFFLEHIHESDRRKIVFRNCNENLNILIEILNSLVIDYRKNDTRRSETTVFQYERLFTSIGSI